MKRIKNHKNLFICTVSLILALICLYISLIYSSVVKLVLLPDPNGPVYTGIKAHLVSEHYHLVKVLLPISILSFIIAIIFFIRLIIEEKRKGNKVIKWIEGNKLIILSISFLLLAIICLVISFAYSSVVKLVLLPDPNGPVYTGIKAHLVSEHYHLVKVLLPISFVSFIASLILFIILMCQKRKANLKRRMTNE